MISGVFTATVILRDPGAAIYLEGQSVRGERLQ